MFTDIATGEKIVDKIWRCFYFRLMILKLNSVFYDKVIDNV